ncbi:TonB family protein [Mariniflexile sp.]|uniref:TonB family protein n=1 Tax=Mariniflexile sp. TaxID=1979402 RepID=UPI004047374F
MNISNQHKALLITLLLSGTVILSVFNLSIKTQDELITESYYEMEPEKELSPEEAKILEALEKLNASKAETNSAFNETDKSKHFTQAYEQIVPAEDYVPASSEENDGADDSSNSLGENKPLKPAINKEELSAFSKVNDLLKNQQNEGVNTKSTVSFSLMDRKKVYIPIPVYLCEVEGKIVVTITVDSNGKVTSTDINTSSTSSNECLKEYALQYAKDSRFNADASKKIQVGSITFSFIGKH